MTIPSAIDRANITELVTQMELRWRELMTLRASPAMYGSESLDGQVAELELWLAKVREIR